MKPWLKKPYKVRAATKEELITHLVSIFGIDEGGSLIKSGHQHSIAYTKPMIETGNMIDDGEGNLIPERIPKEGAFADVKAREPIPELNALAQEPNPSVAHYYSNLAQQTRLDAEYDLLPFRDKFIQVGVGKDGVKGIDRLVGVMNEVAINPHKADEEINWIASDNSIIELTYDDVKGLISAFNVRQKHIFKQYAEWRDGDKQEPFKPKKKTHKNTPQNHT